MALFGNDKGTDREQPMATQQKEPTPGAINMVGEGTVFEGTLRATNDMRISGRVLGKVHVDGRIIVAQEGGIDGEFHATNADVSGSVEGELYVEEQLVLRSSAQVEGRIQTGRLVVEEGATFNGECHMGDRREADRSEVKRAQASKALPKTDRKGSDAKREEASEKRAQNG